MGSDQLLNIELVIVDLNSPGRSFPIPMKREGSWNCNDVLDIRINAADQPRLQLTVDLRGPCCTYGGLLRVDPHNSAVDTFVDNELMDLSEPATFKYLYSP